MNIKKRVEQEIENLETQMPDVGSENYFRLAALNDVLGWIDAAKGTRKPRFVKPTETEIYLAFRDKGLRGSVAFNEAQAFINHYESCGWVIGGNGKKMVSWKHAVANWANRNKEKQQNDGRNSGRIRDTTEDGYKPVFDQMAGLKNRLDRDPELKALGKLVNRSSNKPTRIGE